MSTSTTPSGGTPRRYAFVGLGHRAEMFLTALLGPHADVGTPVAFCDTNRTRMAYHQRLRQQEAPGAAPLPEYGPEDFGTMLTEQRVDAVVVTVIDRLHARFVCEALDHGCDVICEKPLTIDVEGCRQITEAVARSSGRLVVTFNYRYSPRNSAVRRLLLDGEIGEVTSVHFEWLLDTVHGADYFRRWHRDKANSGGLLVHKATHHFDLLNWWLDDLPETVYAQAELRFYGAANAAARGLGPRPRRSSAQAAAGDPFALDLTASPGCASSTSRRSRRTGTTATSTCSRTGSPSRTPWPSSPGTPWRAAHLLAHRPRAVGGLPGRLQRHRGAAGALRVRAGLVGRSLGGGRRGLGAACGRPQRDR